MKLSEAIRLGSMLHPQCFDVLEHVVDGKTVGTCAIGAASEAGYDISYRNIVGEHDLLMCPSCPELHDLQEIIEHLNDYHRWTRERIADWIDTVEPAETPDAAPQPVAVFAAPNRSENPT